MKDSRKTRLMNNGSLVFVAGVILIFIISTILMFATAGNTTNESAVTVAAILLGASDIAQLAWFFIISKMVDL